MDDLRAQELGTFILRGAPAPPRLSLSTVEAISLRVVASSSDAIGRTPTPADSANAASMRRASSSVTGSGVPWWSSSARVTPSSASASGQITGFNNGQLADLRLALGEAPPLASSTVEIGTNLPADAVPPMSVPSTSQRFGMPPAASIMTGMVVMSSSSMTRGFMSET